MKRMLAAVLIMLMLLPVTGALAVGADLLLPDVGGFYFPVTVSLAKNQNLPVLAAPAENAFRAAKGKAAVSLAEPFSAILQEGDYVLVSYAISDSAYRMGYVRADSLPEEITGSLQQFEPTPVPLNISARVDLTDDPLHSGRALLTLAAGTTVDGYCLLRQESDTMDEVNWVQVGTAIDGQPARGFVPLSAIAPLSLPADANGMAELAGAYRFLSGGEVGGDGFHLRADGTGYHLMIAETADTPIEPFRHFERSGDLTWTLYEPQTIGGEAIRVITIDGTDYRFMPTEASMPGFYLLIGDGGGGYERYDEDVIHAYLDSHAADLTAMDHLLRDYIDETFETHLAEMGIDPQTVYTHVLWSDNFTDTAQGYQGLKVEDALIRDTEDSNADWHLTMTFTADSLRIDWAEGWFSKAEEVCGTEVIPVDGSAAAEDAAVYYQAIFDFLERLMLELHG